jgi:DNA modification methylase
VLNEIYNMDCIKGIREKVADKSVDLIVTDPPYLTAYKTNYRKTPNRFSEEIPNDRVRGGQQLLNAYFVECYRVLKDDSSMYVFCSAKTQDIFKQLIELAGFSIKNFIIWVKNNHTAGDLKAQYGQKYEVIIYAQKGRNAIQGKRLTDVWEFDRVSGSKQLHQNQKPIDLIKQCIEKSSQEGDIVLDGFMGSGTTAIACMDTSRNFIGFELDNYYYEKCTDRLDDYLIHGEM